MGYMLVCEWIGRNTAWELGLNKHKPYLDPCMSSIAELFSSEERTDAPAAAFGAVWPTSELLLTLTFVRPLASFEGISVAMIAILE